MLINPTPIPEKKDEVPAVQYTSALLINSGKKGLKPISRLVISWGVKECIDGKACEAQPIILAKGLKNLLGSGGVFLKDIAEEITKADPAQVVIFIPDFYPQLKPDFDFFYLYERIKKSVVGMHRQLEKLVKDVKVFVAFRSGEQQSFEVDNEGFIDALFGTAKTDVVQLEPLGSDHSNKVLFGIETVDLFFDQFGQQCGLLGKEFLWKRSIWEDKNGTVKHVKHADAEMFMMVGGNYLLKSIKKINGGFELISYDSFKVGSIKAMYGGMFLGDIKDYHSFINEPDFSPNYKRTHYQQEGTGRYKFYNVAEPIKHKPEKGGFDTCIKFFKHLFGGDGTLEKPIVGDRFTMFMDWLKIVVQHPKQKLPMIILASKENNTGKSTLLDFLLYVFGNNAVKTNVDDVLRNFNAHNAYQKIKLLEEVFVETEKTAFKEMLKEAITGPLSFVELKGVNRQVIENHAVFIATSNHEEDLMRLEADDTRFWVVKPPAINIENLDIDMLDKMKAEVPALLHYLQNDPITYPRSYRTWFKPEDIRTLEFWKVVERTKPHAERSVEIYMRELFLTYHISSVRIYPEFLEEYFKKKAGYNYTEEQIKQVFKKKGFYEKLSASPSTCKIPVAIDFQELDHLIYFKDQKTTKLPVKRYFEALAEHWCTPEELTIVHTPLRAEEQHTELPKNQLFPNRPPVPFNQTKAPF